MDAATKMADFRELERAYTMAVTTLAKRCKKAEAFVLKMSSLHARVDEGSMNGWQFEKAVERLLVEFHGGIPSPVPSREANKA